MKKLNLLLLLVVIWLLNACGGGGGSTTTPSENSETGYLIDSPVVNMTYSCGGKVDKTITGGKFTCPSLPVTFKVGKLTVAKLNKIPDDGNVYIQDIVGVERDDLNNTNVVKLALFMQSLDDDGNTSKEIKITLKEFNTTKASLEDLNISEVKKVLRKNRVRHIVTEDNAKEHLRRTARKIDKKAPKIILNGKTIFRVEAGETFSDPGASAVDKVDGIVNVVASGSVNSKKVGIYHIKYTATDKAGNRNSKIRTVKVIDSTKPTITLKGAKSNELNHW